MLWFSADKIQCSAGKQLLESDAIIKYLYTEYGDGKVRWLAESYLSWSLVGPKAWR